MHKHAISKPHGHAAWCEHFTVPSMHMPTNIKLIEFTLLKSSQGVNCMCYYASWHNFQTDEKSKKKKRSKSDGSSFFVLLPTVQCDAKNLKLFLNFITKFCVRTPKST